MVRDLVEASMRVTKQSKLEEKYSVADKIVEEKLVEAYGNSNPHERFLLIYKNYSVFPQLVDCYETGLFNRILFEVEYNRRKKNDDDLGVRVQTSHLSDLSPRFL